MIFSCNSCKKDKSLLGVKSYYLSSQDLEVLKESAKTETNGQAAYRLSDYYYFYENDPSTGRKWLTKASNQGHPEAIETLKSLEAGETSK